MKNLAGRKRAGKRRVTRVELTEALGVSLTTVDKLILRGLRAVGTRGRAKVYPLAAARRLAQRLAPKDAAGAAVARSDYRSHAEDFHDRTRRLVEEFVSDDVWQPLWARCVAFIARFTERWPALLADRIGSARPADAGLLMRADGPWVPSPAPWTGLLATMGLTLEEWQARQPQRPAPLLRPLLQGLADAIGTDAHHRALDEALAPPPPKPLAPAPRAVDEGRTQWRDARAAYRRQRIAVRRRHSRRADVAEAITRVVTQVKFDWWRFRGQLAQLVGDPAAAREAAEELRRRTLAKLAALDGLAAAPTSPTPPRPRAARATHP